MGKSDGIMGIFRLKASLPLEQLVMIVSRMTLGMRSLTMSRVLLQIVKASKLRSAPKPSLELVGGPGVVLGHVAVPQGPCKLFGLEE